MGQDGTTAGIGQAAAWVAVLAIVLVAMRSVRSVGADERLVVIRRGRGARLRGPGLVAVVPGLDHAVRIPLRDRWHDVTELDATTRDAVRVTVTAAATGTVSDPLRYALASCPDAAVEWVLEAELRRFLAQRDLAQLATLATTGVLELPAAVSARTAGWGIEIAEVQVGRLDTRVDPGLLRWAGTQQGAPR